MKKSSVKIRITVLITVLMAVLAVLMLASVIMLSHKIANKSVINHMERLMRNNLENLVWKDNDLNLHSDFLFSQDGANVIIYNSKGALLAGQIPGSFTADIPFVNGEERTVDGGRAFYILMDVYYPTSWQDGLWVRIIHESPDFLETASGLIVVGCVSLPVFLLAGAFFTYRIIKSSLKPMENIAETASNINDASDLSLRIGRVGKGDEFTRLADVFDKLLQRLEILFESEKKFAQDASHELRTPITVIKGACDYAIKYGESPEDYKESLGVIQRQTQKMGDIVEQLLRITRLENGTDAVDLQMVDLGLLIKEGINEGGFDRERISMDLPEGIMVKAEPLLMLRLSDNLIANAFKYGKKDGQVWLKLERNENEIIYSVRDDGMGIDSRELSNIWKRFYRAGNNKKAEGTGLGLSFVQQISRIHGGYMSVESETGKGSVFALHLPVLQ